MKVGDLVTLVGDRWSSYSHQGDIGIVTDMNGKEENFSVMFDEGVESHFRHPEHFRVIGDSDENR